MDTNTCDICGKDYPASNGKCNSCNDKPQHTPTPWRISDTPDAIVSINGSVIINRMSISEANAAFIVKACNNHDLIVELLNYVIKEIENTPDELSDALLGLIKIKAKTALAQVEKG